MSIFCHTYPRVEKNEVELNEGEGHAAAGGEGVEQVVAVGVKVQLEELPEFQSGVDHASDAKRCVEK